MWQVSILDLLVKSRGIEYLLIMELLIQGARHPRQLLHRYFSTSPETPYATRS